MTTAVAPEVGFTVQAPVGSHFDFEEVKTAKGTQSLGNVPILVWDNLDAMTTTYGEDGVLAIADGTSLRVSYQNIARRFKAAGKSDNEIAEAQVKFRPGKRTVGESTPASRAARLAKTASEKVDSGALEKLLAKIASGELSDSDLQALVS